MSKDDAPRKAPGIFSLIVSVLGAAIGVQSRSVYEKDFQHGKPIVFIIAGVVFTILLIGGLIALVAFILPDTGG